METLKAPNLTIYFFCELFLLALQCIIIKNCYLAQAHAMVTGVLRIGIHPVKLSLDRTYYK